MIYGNVTEGLIFSAPEFVLEDISYDEMIEMGCSFDNDFVVTESVQDYYNSNLSKVINHISFKTGFNINKRIKKLIDNISKVIKGEGFSGKVLTKVSKIFNDFVNEVKNAIEDIELGFDIDFASSENSYWNSLFLTLIAVIINSVSLYVLVALLGPDIGVKVLAIIIGPIVEELAKQIAIRGGFEKEFLIVFNTLEFTNYVSTAVVDATPVKKLIRYIVVRLAVVGMHISTVLAQKVISSEVVQKALNLDREKDKEKLNLIGYSVGLFIHMFWNASDKAIQKIAGLA